MKFTKSSGLLWTIYYLSGLTPFLVISYQVFAGHIPFWFDPARDFIQALENHKKLMLIGPPTGIPGIFYGPYWVWILSLVLFFTKDPRIVAWLVLTIPYLLIFPAILLLYKKFISFSAIIIMWVFFATSYGIIYATQLWNPHVASFFVPIVIYLLIRVRLEKPQKLDYLFLFFAGMTTGLIDNVHISFGLGFTLGALIWLSAHLFLLKRKNNFNQAVLELFSFLTGIFTMFVPFFIFEVRHGFSQIRTIINTFTASGSVVSVEGLTKDKIIYEFFNRGIGLFQLPFIIGMTFLLLLFMFLLNGLRRKKIVFKEYEQKCLTLVFICAASILAVFLISKNPVWVYHFIGVEVLFLLFFMIILSKFSAAKYILLIWLFFPLVIFTKQYYKILNTPNYQSSDLVTKIYIVKNIMQDAQNQPYEIFVFSPSIYTYDYSYLFLWKASRNFPPEPEKIPKDARLVYVILPPEELGKLKDFVDYRTPSSQYSTKKEMLIPDGTTILRRERIK